MSIVDDLRRRRQPQRAADPVVADDPQTAQLRVRCDELTKRMADLTWDLGGLTYEMAIRDHFRLDVLVKRAAALQEVDAELGEIERLLRTEDTSVTGTCRSCGAPHSRGAIFCWQCGATLMETKAV